MRVAKIMPGDRVFNFCISTPYIKRVWFFNSELKKNKYGSKKLAIEKLTF
tara:strand:- start:1151 stop:1300 length:150 start_codon:yes stop_codon:yes gene_type:complete